MTRTPVYLAQCRNAAALHARAWKSDPFAYGRIFLSLVNGHEDKEPGDGPKYVADAAIKIMQSRGEQL